MAARVARGREVRKAKRPKSESRSKTEVRRAGGWSEVLEGLRWITAKAEELQRHGWAEAELEERPKNDPVKLDIAARLRRETALTIKAIAARVHLGTSKAANAKLHGHLRRGLVTEVTQTPSGI